MCSSNPAFRRNAVRRQPITGEGQVRPARRASLLTFLLPLSLAVGMAQHGLISAQTHQSPAAEHIVEIPAPDGWVRSEVTPDSFGAWLRDLPLKPPSNWIRLYNGNRKHHQSALYQVIALPIGDKDLQQCADVAIRLRSDYLLSRGRIADIAFNFTSGDRARYSDWIVGYRPIVEGDVVTWRKLGRVDSSYQNYQRYLNTVFMYAGSYSLSRELVKVRDVDQVAAGDCFIEGGFPGHVIMVVDVAVDTVSGEKLVLFAQGFIPAQDIHIIRNPSDSALCPWYRVGQGRKLVTPEWTFEWSDIHTFDKTR